MILEILGEVRDRLGPDHIERLIDLIEYEENASGREDPVDIVLNGESILHLPAREIARLTLFDDTDIQGPSSTESYSPTLVSEADVETDPRPIQEHQGAGEWFDRSPSPARQRARSRSPPPSSARRLPDLRSRAEVEAFLREVSTVQIIEEVAARSSSSQTYQ